MGPDPWGAQGEQRSDYIDVAARKRPAVAPNFKHRELQFVPRVTMAAWRRVLMPRRDELPAMSEKHALNVPPAHALGADGKEADGNE